MRLKERWNFFSASLWSSFSSFKPPLCKRNVIVWRHVCIANPSLPLATSCFALFSKGTSHFFGSFCRVLDLIEIFIKKQASSPFVLVCESMSLFFIFLDFSDFFGSNFSNIHSKLAFGHVSCYHNLLLRRSGNQEFHRNATFQTVTVQCHKQFAMIPPLSSSPIWGKYLITGEWKVYC